MKNPITLNNPIRALQEAQNRYGYLSKETLTSISKNLNMPVSKIYGIATFYHQFRMRPIGKHIITVCAGTACHIGGEEVNYDILVRALKLKPVEDTTEDGLFTVNIVRCIGCCSLAPVIKVDEDVYGRIDPPKLKKIIAKYRREA